MKGHEIERRGERKNNQLEKKVTKESSGSSRAPLYSVQKHMIDG